MENQPTKLMSARLVVTMASVVTAFIAFKTFMDFRDTGRLTVADLLISLITLVIMYGVIGFVYWLANRPERQRKP